VDVLSEENSVAMKPVEVYLPSASSVKKGEPEVNWLSDSWCGCLFVCVCMRLRACVCVCAHL
jgi:hypothetical protein